MCTCVFVGVILCMSVFFAIEMYSMNKVDNYRKWRTESRTVMSQMTSYDLERSTS